jgi:hypothetical protein
MTNAVAKSTERLPVISWSNAGRQIAERTTKDTKDTKNRKAKTPVIVSDRNWLGMYGHFWWFRPAFPFVFFVSFVVKNCDSRVCHWATKSHLRPSHAGMANHISALFRGISTRHKVKVSAIWAGCEFCGKFGQNSIRWGRPRYFPAGFLPPLRVLPMTTRPAPSTSQNAVSQGERQGVSPPCCF